MPTIQEKICLLENELRETPYNKATMHHIGLLKARIARLKQELEVKQRKKGKHISYAIKKSGDATVIIVGFPSVGKSTLLNALTNAESKIADYDFTTINVIPGMLEYNGARIQFFDVPGIIEDASKGRGMGLLVLSVIRSSDCVIILLDDINQFEKIKQELYNTGIRLDKRKPNITIEKKSYGGLWLSYSGKKLEKDFILKILREYGLHNADVVIREDVDLEQLLDVLNSNRVYIPSIVVFNKEDLLSWAKKAKIKDKVDLFISAKNGKNLEKLKELLFQRLRFVRIYMKKVGEEPDKPLIMRGHITIKDVCEKIRKDFVRRFQYARVWGKSTKFPGQKVGLEHKLHDDDIVELHLRRF